MKLKTLLYLPFLLFLTFQQAIAQTHKIQYKAAIICQHAKKHEGAITSLTDSTLNLINNKRVTSSISYKDIKFIAVYPLKKRTLTKVIYITALGVTGVTLYREDIKTSLLTGVGGLVILGAIIEGIVYKPVYKVKLDMNSNLPEVKVSLQKYLINDAKPIQRE